jgi:hypothetical protein
LARLLLIACALVSSGCSLRFNDKVTKPVTNVSTGGGCLAQSGDVLNQFETGTLTSERHDAFYSCVNTALNAFLNDTSGKSKDHYEPSELGNFLSNYFLNHKAIQPALLNEAMALKAALVGGSTENLSRDDINRVLAVLGNLRTLTGSLRQHMPMTAASFQARGYTNEQFESVMKTFTLGVAAFGDQVKASQGDYQFTHLSALVGELGKFLYPSGVPASHWTNTLTRAAAALPPAKAILISPPREMIAAADWARVYHLAPRFYSSLLRAQFYFASPLTLVAGGGLANVDHLFREFVATFDYVLKQHPGEVITSDEIDDLAQTLDQQKFLPCSPATFRQFVRVLFGKLLSLPDNQPKVAAEQAKFAVGIDGIANFRENVIFFLEGLHANEALFRAKFGNSFTTGSMSRAEIAAVSDSALLAGTAYKTALSAEAATAVKQTPVEIRTVFAADSWDVVIPENAVVDQFSYSHMMKIHALRSLDRLLFKAYGSAGAPGLTAAQVNAFVDDVFPLLLDTHLVAASMRASISKRLSEATLFLYSSNGQPGITMPEAIEMETLLVATILRAPKTHAAVAVACGTTKVDASKKFLIDAPCYRSQLMLQHAQAWNYLPGLARFMDGLTQDQRLHLFDVMGTFLRKGIDKNADFTSNDSMSYTLLPYYVELLFSRFDANNDGLFNNAEAAQAYPVFRPFLANKANAKGYTKEADYQAIYNFLLAYRVLPTDDKWDYALRRYVLGDKTFTSDRGQVVEIFSALMSL